MILGIFIWIKILSEYLSLFDKNSNILQPAYSQISEILPNKIWRGWPRLRFHLSKAQLSVLSRKGV